MSTLPPGVSYPPSRLDPVTDRYHGVTVADPYRWLEHPETPDTLAWVAAQNTLTADLLATHERAPIRARLAELYNFSRAGSPERRGSRYFFTFNDGLQNQAVLYVQDGLSGRARTLLDPNTFSVDGTVAITAVAPNEDGTLVAYALSRNGSDWQEIFVRDTGTATDRPDRVRWAKFTSIEWARDGSGFYYTRFPEPGAVPAGDEHYFARICFHRLGEPDEADQVIAERPEDKDAVLQATLSTDGRWLVVTSFRGSSDDCEVFVRDVTRGHRAAMTPLFTGFRAAYAFVDAVDTRLYFRTTSRAPMGRLVAVDMSGLPTPDESGEAPMTTVVPEQADHLSSAGIVHQQIVAVYLRHASDQVRLFDLTGRQTGTIRLPGLGSLTGVTGRADDRELFFRFSSFTHPPTVYRYDFASKATLPFLPAMVDRGERSDAGLVPFVVTQVWYPSKDGTMISMFLVHDRGLTRDADRPVLLTGYGGFGVNLSPQYDPAYFVWLERGGIVAVPNLRGGGEYGDAWHKAGMFEKKQNVFDDFIAAAEWLVAEKYTRPDRLIIEGGSNGGLLVGAVMIQRPDLFGAVVCRVPVADMLRYHHFTVGRFWISEYGSADDPEQFKHLYAYSPLHNVKDGVKYPPILIMTADTDDRVAPGMAKKFAARLQAATAAIPDAGPILIRVETRAGHGVGKPVAKQIEEEADVFAFLFRHLR